MTHPTAACPHPDCISHCTPCSVDALLVETGDLAAGGAILECFLGRAPEDYGGDWDFFVGQDNVERWRALLQVLGALPCRHGCSATARCWRATPVFT